MTRGSRIVKQVNIDGELIDDYDTRLTVKELYKVIKDSFPNVKRCSDNNLYIISEWNDDKFLIRAKNITYLGYPHKSYKKRYQIPKDLEDFYTYAKKNGYKPLLIGVYTYKELTIFVDYSIETYIGKKHNNSGAHVYATDIQQVLLIDEDNIEKKESSTYGYFEKVDMNKNRVTVFDTNSVKYYLQMRHENTDAIYKELQELKTSFEKLERRRTGKERDVEIPPKFIESNLKIRGGKCLPNKTRNIILNYFVTLRDKKWEGIDCYKLMLEHNYRNKNQAEWPGFFLEYSFEKYLIENDYLDVVHYAQDKGEDGVDLDLYLEEIKTYADLKAHSSDKKDIPGNKKETIDSILKTCSEIIYIVCEHDTEMDTEHGLEVTQYWNTNKTNRKPNQNMYSYKSRMKHSVTLRNVSILSINSSNAKYLKGFTQGKNSNGKPRKVKIMIEGNNIKKFERIKYDL